MICSFMYLSASGSAAGLPAIASLIDCFPEVELGLKSSLVISSIDRRTMMIFANITEEVPLVNWDIQ